MEKILTCECVGVLVLISIFSKNAYRKLPIKHPRILFKNKNFWVSAFSN